MLDSALRSQARQAWSDGVMMVVVHGAARGGDTLADEWVATYAAPPYRWPVIAEPHPIDGAAWRVEGLRAGHNRNQRMVDAGADVCLAFIMPCAKPGCRKNAGRPHESHGASDCVARAKLAGIPVIPHYGGK